MSESEEMYLITVVGLSEQEPDAPVPISRLAAELSVQTVSANQMIRKLADASLVHYEPYKGVELTETGREWALHVLRHRRLWEVFLVEKLHLSLEEADALACRMEHITPCEVAQRLSKYLGDPVVSPQGKPIPSSVVTTFVTTQSLAGLSVGQTGQIIYLDMNAPAHSFFESEGLRPGVILTVEAVGSSGGMLLRTNGHTIHVDPTLAQKVFVKLSNPSTSLRTSL